MKTLNERILDNIPVSVITINKDGYIVSANKCYQNFAKTKDYKNHNIFTDDFFIRENLVNDYKKLFVDGSVVRKEGCYEKNSQGEDKYLKIVAVPLRDGQGNIEGALSMAVDNTEVVLLKNELEKLNKELEQKVEQRTVQLNVANQELRRVLQLRSVFMADISHEIRTSLSIIQGNLELASQNLPKEKKPEEMYKYIFTEVDRISDMLSDLALLERSDLSETVHYKKISIDRLISKIIKSFGAVAAGKGVKIKANRNQTDLGLVADEAKIEKLIKNLVENAIKYNREGGWVNVRAEKSNDEIIIRVEDNGIGISEEHLPNIFERFYRVDQTRSRGEGGMGLGLAICQWIAELHGGKIEVASKVGQGSRFTARLPRVE